MDVSSHSNGSPSSPVSRLQKNDVHPEETRSIGRQEEETRIEPRYTDHDDLLITSDTSKCANPSEAGLNLVNQPSLYPEQSMVETQNDIDHDWEAKEIHPVSEVTATVAKETGPASEVNPTVAKETGPASEVNPTVAKETGPASEGNPTVTRETSPASEVNATVTRETSPASEVNATVTRETCPASMVKTQIQPISSEAEQDTETEVDDNHRLHEGEARTIYSDDEEHLTDTETEAEREDGTTEDEDLGFAAAGNTVTFGDVDDIDLDDLLDDSSDEELPTLQEIYQRCQTIRNRRFYADLYNVWQRKIQEDEREDAIKILSASGFGKGVPDEIGDGLDKALSLVPERFWRNDSSANDISIEDLKMIVEEKKDAEERAQYREYCQADLEAGSKSGGQARKRRSAIATGGGQSSAILHNYLKMNLLKSHVPMYYFPSYLQRFKEATKPDPESEDEENSDSD